MTAGVLSYSLLAPRSSFFCWRAVIVSVRGGISRRTVTLLCITAIALTCAGYFANKLFYFGPGLPQRDYMADYTQHAVQASGVSVERADAARAKLLEIEQTLRSEFLDDLHAVDASFGLLGSEAEGDDVWADIEPVVLASLQKVEEQGMRQEADELIALGLFVDLNVIQADPYAQPTPPQIDTLRQLARMEADFLVLAARAGDAEGVVEAYERIAGLADVVASGGGGIIVHLTGIAIRTTGIEHLMDAVCAREHDLTFLEELQDLAEIDKDWPDVSTVFEGELIGSRHLASQLGNLRLKAVNPAYQTKLMERGFQSALDLWSSHPQGPVAGLREFRGSGETFQATGLLADLLLPSIENYLVAVTHFQLMRVAERTVLAIELHRARTGSLPASLEALVPGYLTSEPIDPFSRVLLVYVIEPTLPKGYRLYARGADGQDDGGTFEPERRAEAISLDARGVDYPLVPRHP